MVMRFGMSEKLGPRVFGHDHGQPFLGREITARAKHSTDTAAAIDHAIRELVDDALTRATNLLHEHREALSMGAEALLHDETLDREQFLTVLENADDAQRAVSPSQDRPAGREPVRLP
jgi:cell division protease FtsH